MSKGKRSEVTHRTPAQIKRHREERKHDPEYQRKKKIWDKNYRENPGGKGDRAHKVALSDGGAAAGSNLTRKSASENRGHGKGRNGTKPSAKTLQIRKRLRG